MRTLWPSTYRIGLRRTQSTPDSSKESILGSCSLLSSVDLFDSLEFEAIRDYYKYPLSRYIAAYDVAFPSVNFTSMVDLSAFTREDQNEAIESVLNTYAIRYGDEYAALG